AGLFIFLFTLMFGVVSVIDGANFTDYHFFLIQGMLKNPFLFLLVLLLWLLYAKKSEQFIVNIIRRPDFSFLNILSLLDGKKLYRLLVWVQFLLLLPIVFYAFIIFASGFYTHEYIKCLIILLYIISICLISALWYLFIIQNPGNSTGTMNGKFSLKTRETPYWSLFIRYIGIDKKLLFLGIKIYSCSVLYLMLVNQTQIDYDLRMIILFFSLGILGHGLLIHQLRDLEETRLTYYRTVPISLFKRFMQYAILYFVLLIPEIITITFLTPQYIHYEDAIIFVLLSYSILLFLNSLLFIQFFRMKDYLKIILCIFFIEYFSVLTGTSPLLCALLFISAISTFFFRYYRFER
ncbi:MAG TPA: hypothetical protein VII44_04900, partial [Puia sp.]